MPTDKFPIVNLTVRVAHACGTSNAHPSHVNWTINKQSFVDVHFHWQTHINNCIDNFYDTALLSGNMCCDICLTTGINQYQHH